MNIGLNFACKSFLFALATTGANAETCGSTNVLSATTLSGERKELTIDTAILNKTPEWSPGIGEPPLSIDKAANIALPWAKNHYKNFDSTHIREITLGNSACFGTNKHWYYIFEFEPVFEGNQMSSTGNWLAVLMDGTIVETKTLKAVP